MHGHEEKGCGSGTGEEVERITARAALICCYMRRACRISSSFFRASLGNGKVLDPISVLADRWHD
jgi:hypothetical protein